MPALSKILLPVDFSERSVAAAGYARVLAGRLGSEVVLLHVLTPPQYEFGALNIGGSMLAELYRTRSQQAAKDMEAFEAAHLAGIQVQPLVLEGDPASKIVESATAAGARLIMMPTHGYGPFRRFILGSNTAKVLHDADCPVWTGVHIEEASPAENNTVRQVLCAVDLGPQSSKTLCWAAMLAREFGAHLTLMHAISASGEARDASWQEQVWEAASVECGRLQERLETDAETVIEAGDAPATICAAASRVAADVLVIGRGSAAGVYGRLRTNAYAIIRQSPCPVVSV